MINDGVDARIKGMLASALACANNEMAGIWQLKIHLAAGSLAQVLGVAPIETAAFEYQLRGLGFADLALFHVGGGATLVEAKGPLCNRDICAGIGQLFMYEAALRRQRHTTFVNKILCAPVIAEDSMPTWEACQIAGIKFIHLAPHSMSQEILRAAEDANG